MTNTFIFHVLVMTFCVIGNYFVMFLLHKTLREDATRCMRNMSAEADCIWRAKRNKSLKDSDTGSLKRTCPLCLKLFNNDRF